MSRVGCLLQKPAFVFPNNALPRQHTNPFRLILICPCRVFHCLSAGTGFRLRPRPPPTTPRFRSIHPHPRAHHQSFVRELPGHRTRISSVDVNKVNSNVVTLSGSELRVWNTNGRLLASCSVTAQRRGASPTCATSTDCPDWQVGYCKRVAERWVATMSR